MPLLQEPEAILLDLIGSPNLRSRRSIYRTYDHQVQDNTVIGPGFDAALLRVPATNKGLALTTDGNARYVALDDPLPSVFEAVNPEFKTQQLTAGAMPPWLAQDDGDYWWSDFREIRTDCVLFFADDVRPGNYVIRYVARVRAAGTVTAPPAKAEEMYHPDRFGLTETQTIISAARL